MKNLRILVLSPHTDDAELGAGGTIAKLIHDNTVYYAAFSTCEESLPEGLPPDTLEKEVRAATQTLGINPDNLHIFKHRVRHLPYIRQDVLDNIIDLRNRIRPDIVIIPSENDYHQDHQVVSNEAIRAFKTHASIICYELPWNHVNFSSTLFVRLEEQHIRTKLEALQSYRSQIALEKPYFSEEFILGLAKTRGVQCNAAYAESFEVVRWRM